MIETDANHYLNRICTFCADFFDGNYCYEVTYPSPTNTLETSARMCESCYNSIEVVHTSKEKYPAIMPSNIGT